MSCSLDLTYNDDRWATIISPDQEGCNEYLQSIRTSLIGRRALHIGIGTSSVYRSFYDTFSLIDGITIMDSEIAVAKQYPDFPYNIYKMNKYDALNIQSLPEYDVIIDNNLKQHACCQQHWEEFFVELLNHISLGGILLTHQQGYAPHINRVTFLTDKELEDLSGSQFDLTIVSNMKNAEQHCPVVLTRIK